MIAVEKAKKLIIENTENLPTVRRNITDALGCILSDNVVSPVNLPPFDQTAMDGFALKMEDHIGNNKIIVIGEVAAGKRVFKKINTGEAIRIYTGAYIPKGVDTVVVQEKAKTENGNLIIEDPELSTGANIRKAGSQIKRGKIALPKGIMLTPGGIGYLTAMGVSSVNVINTPRVTVIVTGNELKKPGERLEKGQIYESNSYALQSALESIYLKVHKTILVRDDEQELYKIIKKQVTGCDVLLITGGISVGKYDFTGKILANLGIEDIFYKVKQKPGKPLFFGKHKKTLVFGLPGNPAAVLSCFYEYVLPSIRIMQGRKDVFLKKIILPITEDYPKKKGLSFFLKGKIENDAVTPLEGQESFILSSFAVADSLIYLPEESENIKKGDLVEVHLLPCI